jgi:uncharacterized membrane protein YdjX (TVP38/TMEM64 family)
MSAIARAGASSGHGTARYWIAASFAVCVLVALTLAWRYTPLAQLIEPDHVTALAKAVRGTWWGPIALIAAYAPAAFLLLPRQVLTLFSAIAFGPLLGFVYAMAGVLVTAIVAYYVGRALSTSTVDRLARGKLQRLKDLMCRHAFVAVLTLRVLPTAPFVVESMACGVVRIPFTWYCLGTLAGMAPGVLATTVFGHQIAAALDHSAKVNWWIAGGALVAFIVVVLVLRRVLSD